MRTWRERSGGGAEPQSEPSRTRRSTASAASTDSFRMPLGREAKLEELTDALVRRPAASPTKPPQSPRSRWQFGWGAVRSAVRPRRVPPVPALCRRHLARGRGAARPAARLGMLNVEGGHPGDAAHAVIRRLTAPAAGTLRIEGELATPTRKGTASRGPDRLPARGRVGEWAVAHEPPSPTRRRIARRLGGRHDRLHRRLPRRRPTSRHLHLETTLRLHPRRRHRSKAGTRSTASTARSRRPRRSIAGGNWPKCC